MAGFQVANFDFGKNITENNLKAAQIAASERASERRVELDKARLEEDARQFDERMAMADRAMEEGGSGSRASRSGGASSGGARSSQWDEAIRRQQYDDDEKAFRQKNLELESFLSIRKSEDDDRANQQARIENAYGNAILASELGGGFLSPKQVEYFNSQNGTKYNYIGKVDPTSGEAFSDGKLHFITYNVDKNGRVVMDAKNGRPTLIEDNPISPEFYKLTLDGYFNKYKEHFGKRDIENSEYVDNEAYRSYKKNYKTSDPDHISNQVGGGAGGREIGSGAVMKTYDRRPHDVEMYSNFREPGMTAGGYVSGRKADGTRYGYNLGRQKSEAELWHQFSVGPSDDGKTQVRGYKNELTGEVAYVKDGENPPWRQAQGNNGKLSVDDRLAIEREKNKGKIDVENARGQNRIDLANLTGEQKKELQNSINAMKKYGIDVTSAVRMAIGGNRTKNVPFNDKVFTYYSNRLDVLNSKGTLTAAEQKERDKAQRIVDGMTNGVMGIEEKQETPDWMSAFASGDAANAAKPQNREGQKSAQNAQVQKPSKTTNIQTTAVQKQTAVPQGEPQTTKEQTMSAKPPEQKRETTKLTPAEQSVGRDAVAMFKKIHPDITDVDDNPEKYDKQLTSIAQSLSGDYSYKSNFTLQKERDRKAAQDKELEQTAAEQENLRKQTLANLNGRDKAVYQKAMELYAPLYERAKLQAREGHGGDYEESVRKKFAEYVKEYNTKHGLKFVDKLSRPDRQVFGDYHVADLLSDIFGNDAGKYLGPVGSRGNSQLRLQSHGKNK